MRIQHLAAVGPDILRAGDNAVVKGLLPICLRGRTLIHGNITRAVAHRGQQGAVLSEDQAPDSVRVVDDWSPGRGGFTEQNRATAVIH